MRLNQPSKTILVLTDFSGAARNAANYSLVLARKFGADILLFHSYFVPISTFDPWPSSAYPAIRENGLSKLQEESARLTQLATTTGNAIVPDIECIMEAGSIAENACALISERKNILMVVLGGYRARNNDDFQNGTAIKEVLGQAKCPVVIVPEFEFLEG